MVRRTIRRRWRLLVLVSSIAGAGGCHWLIPHHPQGVPEGGTPPTGDLIRQRREHRQNPDARPLDGAPAGDRVAPDAKQNRPQLYFQDFSQTAELVDDGSGTWQIKDGHLGQTSCGVCPESAAPGQSWSDVTVRTSVRAHQLCYLLLVFPMMNEAGAIVRAASYKPSGCQNNRYYFCVLNFEHHALYVGARKPSLNCGSVDQTLALPALKLGTPYELELTAQGKQLLCRAWVDGTWHTKTWTDTSADPIAAGSAGLIADEITASFDFLEVLGP